MLLLKTNPFAGLINVVNHYLNKTFLKNFINSFLHYIYYIILYYTTISMLTLFFLGYGQNLTATREMKKEKIPDMGSRSPLKIEQAKESGDAWVKIAFTTLQTRKDQYGMLFAIRFLNNTDKAIESYSAYTSEVGVSTLQSIKTLGGITVNGITYEYFLVKVAADSSNRTSTTVQLNFYAGQ